MKRKLDKSKPEVAARDYFGDLNAFHASVYLLPEDRNASETVGSDQEPPTESVEAETVEC